MKKPIIKNWIKYWSTTIAITGMLAMGACDNNNNADDAVNTTEETVTTAREDVSQNLEEMETETEELANTEETEVKRTSPAWGSSSIRNMDAHLEEFQNVNEAITETLTDGNNQLNEGSTPETYNEQGQPLNNTDEPNGTSQDEPATNTNTTGEEDEGLFEDKEAVDEDQKPAAAEEENNELFFEDEEPAEEKSNKEQNTEGTGQEEDEMFFEDKEPADSNQEGNTESMNSSSQQNQSAVNNGAEQRTFDEQGFTEEVDPQDQQEVTESNPESTNTYDKQSNTEFGQNAGAEDQGVIYQQYMVLYSQDLSDEDRQRMEDIGNQYNERRESMRGQINDETGAYISPEVDAQPTVGYEELMKRVQENITYPQDAVAAEMEGTVFVNFVVDENGNITEAKAFEDVIVPAASLESTTTPLNPTKFSEQEIEELRVEMRKEAERAVQQTSGMWEAGMQDGQKVKTELQLPVKFEIADVTGGTGTE